MTQRPQASVAELADAIDSLAPSSDPVTELARKHSSLPLSGDMGGVIALTKSGDIVCLSWEGDVGPLDDVRTRDVALAVGCKRFPFLERFLPRREPMDPTCPVCEGSGVEPLTANVGLEGIVCWCGGLGWIPSDWPNR